jgi:hypothetical protein
MPGGENMNTGREQEEAEQGRQETHGSTMAKAEHVDETEFGETKSLKNEVNQPIKPHRRRHGWAGWHGITGC